MLEFKHTESTHAAQFGWNSCKIDLFILYLAYQLNFLTEYVVGFQAESKRIFLNVIRIFIVNLRYETPFKIKIDQQPHRGGIYFNHPKSIRGSLIGFSFYEYASQ